VQLCGVSTSSISNALCATYVTNASGMQMNEVLSVALTPKHIAQVVGALKRSVKIIVVRGEREQGSIKSV
jgi:hypothetical protein